MYKHLLMKIQCSPVIYRRAYNSTRKTYTTQLFVLSGKSFPAKVKYIYIYLNYIKFLAQVNDFINYKNKGAIVT